MSSNQQHHRRRRAAASSGMGGPVVASSPRQHGIAPSPDSKKSKRSFWTGFLRRQVSRKAVSSIGDASSIATSSASAIGGDTLLPKSYKMPSPQGVTGRKRHGERGKAQLHLHHTTTTRPNNLCASVQNSFLMGGVDKRRYRRKPKGLLYRIFWSSLPRRLCLGFVLLYLVVYHLLVPVGSMLVPVLFRYLYHGGEGYNNNNNDDYDSLKGLVHSPRFDNLPSVQKERKYLEKIDEDRKVLRKYGSGGWLPGLAKTLEEIDPAWFHRFDADFDSRKYDRRYSRSNSQSHSNSKSNSKSQSHSDSKSNEDEGAAAAAKAQEQDQNDASAKAQKKTDAVDASGADASNGERHQQRQDAEANHGEPPVKKKRYHKAVVSDESGSNSSNRRLLEVKGGMADELEPGEFLLPLRTLQNMDKLGAEFSSCGIAPSSEGATTTTTTEVAATLVVQTSIDRMWILGETCSRWHTDPIVAVVFVPHVLTFVEEHGDSEQYASLVKKLEDTEKHLLSGENCPNLTLVRYKADRIESLNGRYPVNRLRNVGLDLVTTSHVLVMDVDFVPSRDLEKLARDAIAADSASHEDSNNDDETQQQQQQQGNHRRALVVPAFEKKAPVSCSDSDDPESCISRFLKQDGAFLPRTFDELKECYTGGDKDCVVFQSEYNWDGHSTTGSDRWMEKDWYDDGDGETKKKNKKKQGRRQRSFRKISCFHTARYEPYVILEWCPVKQQDTPSSLSSPIAPYYDERFHGYGKNKIELVSHLRRSGYRFEILPEGFLVHNPHPESSTKETWLNHDKSSDLHASMDALYQKFMDDLMSKYEKIHPDTTKLCHHR